MTDEKMNEKRSFHWLKRYEPTLTPIGALALIFGIIYGFAGSEYRAHIDSLQTSLKEVTESYQVLSRKAEGLFEPRLIREEILTNKHREIWTHGSAVGFEIQANWKSHIVPMEKYRYPSVYHAWLDFDFWNEFDSAHTDTIPEKLRIRHNEIYEYSVKGTRYYAIFKVPNPEADTVLAAIYVLDPIYKPAGE